MWKKLNASAICLWIDANIYYIYFIVLCHCDQVTLSSSFCSFVWLNHLTMDDKTTDSILWLFILYFMLLYLYYSYCFLTPCSQCLFKDFFPFCFFLFFFLAKNKKGKERRDDKKMTKFFPFCVMKDWIRGCLFICLFFSFCFFYFCFVSYFFWVFVCFIVFSMSWKWKMSW